VSFLTVCNPAAGSTAVKLRHSSDQYMLKKQKIEGDRSNKSGSEKGGQKVPA
jgi:hypothetical protein